MIIELVNNSGNNYNSVAMFRSVDLHQLNENSALIQLDLDRQYLDRQYFRINLAVSVIQLIFVLQMYACFPNHKLGPDMHWQLVRILTTTGISIS